MHPFIRHLQDEIGSAWYRSTQANLDKIAMGTVCIAVTLSPDGKIMQLRVVSNTSNEVLERISLAAIREAHIPPVPHELLIDGKYEEELRFTLYPN
jgi:TonB family protein